MTKSKTDKHLTLSYKKTISKSDLHPLKGVGNGKIDVFKELTRPFADLRYLSYRRPMSFEKKNENFSFIHILRIMRLSVQKRELNVTKSKKKPQTNIPEI